MLNFSVKVGKDDHLVEIHCVMAGDDLNLCLGGGQRPHIGAAALAVPRKSLRGDGGLSASASVICVTGHMEDQLARDISLKAAARLNRRVLVSAGLHIDGAGPEDIALLTANSYKAVELALAEVESRSS